MADLPAEVTAAWEERQPPVVFTTVDSNGVPNAIYATCVSLYDGSKVIIANNYFHKTLVNIRDGYRGTVLFITPDRKAYQVKGTVSYHEAGPYYEDKALESCAPAGAWGGGVACRGGILRC